MGLRQYLLQRPVKEIPLETEEGRCANCGALLSGKYCSQCGEKAFNSNDLRLRHFFNEAFHLFTHFDSRFFRSLKMLLFKPGLLTEEYLNGRRKRYMAPMQLFIIVNVFYFLYISVVPINTLTSYLAIQYRMLPYSGLIRQLVDARLVELHMSFDAYAKLFDAHLSALAKSLVILMIPLLGACLAVVYSLRRYYFTAHLVFATHFYAFFLLFGSVGATLLLLAIMAMLRLLGLYPESIHGYEAGITLLFGVIFGIYLYFGLRRVYSESRLWTVLKAAALTVSLLYILFLYRLILFFATFYTLKPHP